MFKIVKCLFPKCDNPVVGIIKSSRPPHTEYYVCEKHYTFVDCVRDDNASEWFTRLCEDTSKQELIDSLNW